MATRRQSSSEQQPAAVHVPRHSGDLVPGDPRINRKGRAKGRKNNITVDVLKMVQEATRLSGETYLKDKAKYPELEDFDKDIDAGVAYLAVQANRNPKAFMSLLSKAIPRKLDVDVNVLTGDMLKMISDGRQRVADRSKVIEGTAVPNE